MRDDQAPAVVCPVPHRKDPERPRAVGRGMLICRGHYHGLERQIAEAQALDDDLLRAYTVAGNHGEKVHTSTTPGLNLRDDVMDARRILRAAFTYWSGYIATERQLAAISSTQPLNHHAGRLLTHLPWLANEELTIEQLHWDIDNAFRLGRRIVAPSGTRTLDLGDCVEDIACTVDTREGLPCTGVLRVTLYPEDPNLPSPHIITCTDCGHEYLPNRWLKLGERIFNRQQAAS